MMSVLKKLPLVLLFVIWAGYPVVHALQHHDLNDHPSTSHHDQHSVDHHEDEIDLVDHHHSDIHPHLDFIAVRNGAGKQRNTPFKLSNYGFNMPVMAQDFLINRYRPPPSLITEFRPKDPFRFRNRPLII